MTDKHLKKLNRKELLEILVFQEREIERLKGELKLVNEKLESREIYIKNAGSIAEAALKMNHIFEDADVAAQQYLENIKKMAQMEQKTLKRIRKKEREIQEKLKQLYREDNIYARSRSVLIERGSEDE